MPAAHPEPVVELLEAGALVAHLDALAQLRMSVFREYPYLYEGTLDYERAYLSGFAASPRGALVIARDGDRVVGASTAMPLDDHSDAAVLAPPLEAAGFSPARVYYFGESVLLPSARGRGIGHAFFELREQAARRHGFDVCAFCAVARPANHPARPADYRPHDAFWTRRGYRHHADVVASFEWRDVGEPLSTHKPMVFWIRELPP
ncbi:MAG: GNAT family N-acetyltransferase [Polyangiales bacterium]